MSKTKTRFDRTDPSTWDMRNATVRTGADAAASGRATLEAAGVDVDAVERSVGRPRVGGGRGAKGNRSPRINVAITDNQAARLDELRRNGRSRSEVVREALDEYLNAHA